MLPLLGELLLWPSVQAAVTLPTKHIQQNKIAAYKWDFQQTSVALGGGLSWHCFNPERETMKPKPAVTCWGKTIESFLLISAHTHAHASHRINTDHLPTWRSKKKSRLFLLFGRSDRSGNQHYRCGTILMLDGERAKRSRWFCWPEFDSWWLLCFSGCVVRAYGLSGHHLLIKAMMVTPTPCRIRVRGVDLESAIAGAALRANPNPIRTNFTWTLENQISSPAPEQFGSSSADILRNNSLKLLPFACVNTWARAGPSGLHTN